MAKRKRTRCLDCGSERVLYGDGVLVYTEAEADELARMAHRLEELSLAGGRAWDHNESIDPDWAAPGCLSRNESAIPDMTLDEWRTWIDSAVPSPAN